MPSLYRCENNHMLKNTLKKEKDCEKRNEENSPSLNSLKNDKLNFRTCKKNTINSLYEVEHFLRNFNHFSKYLKLYKILK